MNLIVNKLKSDFNSNNNRKYDFFLEKKSEISKNNITIIKKEF